MLFAAYVALIVLGTLRGAGVGVGLVLLMRGGGDFWTCVGNVIVLVVVVFAAVAIGTVV